MWSGSCPDFAHNGYFSASDCLFCFKKNYLQIFIWLYILVRKRIGPQGSIVCGAALPCIFFYARSCFHCLNPWPSGDMTTTLTLTPRVICPKKFKWDHFWEKFRFHSWKFSFQSSYLVDCLHPEFMILVLLSLCPIGFKILALWVLTFKVLALNSLYF